MRLKKLFELKYKKPDPKDTLGYKRADMPQVKKENYPEFMEYLEKNGARFTTEKDIPAKDLKPVQSEFSDAGIERQSKKTGSRKPVIVSSDNYIIDGHHRWLVALNFEDTVDVIRVNMPVNQLLKLVLEFPKTYYKDIYTEGYKLQLERGSDMDILHIVDTKTGKRTEVRGKPNYEIKNDPDDKLHQLLDKIGKAANISELLNGEPVGINPNHPDGKSAKTDTDRAFNEDSMMSWAKRKLSHVTHAEQYKNAAKKLHEILTRKYKETNGNLRHSLGYYAHMLSRQTGEKINWKELQKEYLDTFGNMYFENVNERLVKMDPKGPTNLKKLPKKSKYERRKEMLQQLDDLNNNTLKDAVGDTQPHLYLDMDGVQADFFNEWAKWYSEKTGKQISSYKDIGDADAQLASIMELTNQGPEFVEKFFANLPVLQGFNTVLSWIKQNNISYSVLSAPLRGNNEASIKGKKSWLAKHNPGSVQEIFTGRKESYAINKQTKQPNVLIDDHGKYIDRWTARGGIGIKHHNTNPQATIEALKKIYSKEDSVQENFADGKKKGKSRPGRVKRSGASCKGSVTDLRAKAKKASGEKAKMYHWCANMKSGKKKK